ncbi:hypothetical protein XFF6166_410058 [Xanthomonas citri pv. fuscans]|nr:hypothetical protein XFF6166_410058 [Xanthomonas citri pv. fuscans]SOO00365.1 hypothetical protein XFF6960_300002 [Xanthomonas citri pv. fuscans]SOO07026.1 hypothetical protein XFF7767_90002 [Xanthomonas citri pv. fuscans]SOO09783.1 hypothetical protein XFF6970_450002 [Xanthomonas citri pv. fuscans]SOO13841.1 hypothetical protein XFF7766_250002 [Xanthomonas citri pv. fuscans]
MTINMALLGAVGFDMHWLLRRIAFGVARGKRLPVSMSRRVRCLVPDTGSNLFACPSAGADSTGAPFCLRP